MRVEKKYLLDPVSESRLRNLLGAVMSADRHNGESGYQVRSLYFDTLDNSDFYDKDDGYHYRKKIRLRIYSPEDKTAKLEKKEKLGDTQRKQSLSISRADAEKLIAGDYTVLLSYPGSFALSVYELMTSHHYLPKCLVEYNRTAFTAPENDTRITFDRDLRASECCYDLFSPSANLYPVSFQPVTTLEVKYNHFLLSYLTDLLALADTRQTSCSKYVLARSVSLYQA